MNPVHTFLFYFHIMLLCCHLFVNTMGLKHNMCYRQTILAIEITDSLRAVIADKINHTL